MVAVGVAWLQALYTFALAEHGSVPRAFTEVRRFLLEQLDLRALAVAALVAVPAVPVVLARIRKASAGSALGWVFGASVTVGFPALIALKGPSCDGVFLVLIHMLVGGGLLFASWISDRVQARRS